MPFISATGSTLYHRNKIAVRSNPINKRNTFVRTLAVMCAIVAATSRADAITPPVSTTPAAKASGSNLPACGAPPAETPLQTEQGSAGVMYNFAEHPTSIRAVAKKLLGAAVDASAEAQKGGCRGPCGPEQTPNIVFRVAPVTLMPKTEQQPLCVRLADETGKRPLKYGLHEFSSIEKFDAWIMQFSQGLGADGKLLYQQCGGNCDPSYTFIIAPGKSGLKVNTEVYCGFTRDRKNEMFNLSTALRPQCKQALR